MVDTGSLSIPEILNNEPHNIISNIDDLKNIRQYLVKTKVSNILQSTVDQSLYLDLYKFLLNSTLNPSTKNEFRTLASDCLSIWLQRATQISLNKSQDLPTNAVTSVSDQDAQLIFAFVCDSWTDSDSFLSAVLKELFNRLLSLITSTWRLELCTKCLQQWTLHVMKFDHDQRVLYVLLELLTKHVSGMFLLQHYPLFISEGLSYIGSNALAQQVGKVMFSICSIILTEWTGDGKNNIKCNEDIAQEWTDLWADPARAALLNAKTRGHIQTHFLSLMFKRLPQSFDIFIKPMTKIDMNTPENEVLAILECINLAQKQGVFDVLAPKDNFITKELFETLLQHSSPELRITTLSLIGASQQSSKPVSRYIFDVLKRSLDGFFIESNPGFREQVHRYLRQFFLRVRASLWAMEKDFEKRLKKGDDIGSEQLKQQIEFVEFFVSWFVKYLERCLRPSASYQYKYTGMLLIQMLANIGLDQNVRPECLEKNHKGFPFQEPIYTKSMVIILICNIANNYEDVRLMATKILTMAKLPVPFIEDHKQIELLINHSFERTSGAWGENIDAGARGLELAFNLFYNFSVIKEGPDCNVQQCTKLLIQITHKLEGEIKLLNENYTFAACNHPVHGFFTALGSILRSIDFDLFTKDKDFQNQLPELVNKMYICAKHIWGNVKKVLYHDPYNDNTHKDLAEARDLNFEALDEYSQTKLLSYSRKSVRESTAMLKVLLDKIPRKNTARCNIEIFKDKTIVDIGNLLLDQLFEIKHPAAVSFIYSAFVSSCKRCNLTSGLEKQPEKWLAENISLIESEKRFITRRSGGLPYAICAILTAEINPNDRTLISSTFEHLLRIAQSPVISVGNKNQEIPQVHAFNCIKSLFVETNLSNRSAWFIEPALKLSIVGFSSDNWAIRNCSVMLFSTLHAKLFGATRPTKSKYLVSTSPAKTFFSKYKSLRAVLLDSLQEYTAHINKNCSQVENIFLILTLISNLEATSDYDGLEDFKPIIIACLESKVWKVREMAAQVIPSLFKNQSSENILHTLLSDISISKQNKLHGVLMASLNIIIHNQGQLSEQEHLSLPVNFENEEKVITSNNLSPSYFSKLIPFLFWKFDEFVVYNPSAETALAYIRILKHLYISYLNGSDRDFLPEFENFMIPKFKMLWNHQNSDGLSSSRRVLQSEIAETLLNFSLFKKNNGRCDTEMQESFGLIKQMISNHHNYEVQLMAMKFLEENTQYLTDKHAEDILQILWEIFDSNAWSQVCGSAAKLFSTLFLKFSQRSSSSLFFKNALKYWSVLFKTISLKASTEDISESCLEALGIFSAILYNSDSDEEIDKRIEEWATLVELFSHDSESYPSRDAALTSLISFLSIVNKPSLSISVIRITTHIDILLRLFLFLSDDDIIIRTKAAKYVCQMLDLKFMATPSYCERELLFSYISVNLPFSFLLSKSQYSFIVDYLVGKLFSLISTSKSAETRFTEALKAENSLFTTEKPNIFRDEVTKFEQYQNAIFFVVEFTKEKRLKDLSITSETTQMIEQWVKGGVHAVFEVLEKLGNDDSSLLKWTNNSLIVEEISRVGIAINVYLGLTEGYITDKLAEEIRELKDSQIFQLAHINIIT